mmetsp:Transcript_13865/g.44365  ORF Transcript_13865/g.44365 Transcript_13865/m.44365 type:complete len:228 (+) Transcript_13865:402-1085(+)
MWMCLSWSRPTRRRSSSISRCSQTTKTARCARRFARASRPSFRCGPTLSACRSTPWCHSCSTFSRPRTRTWPLMRSSSSRRSARSPPWPRRLSRRGCSPSSRCSCATCTSPRRRLCHSGQTLRTTPRCPTGPRILCQCSTVVLTSSAAMTMTTMRTGTTMMRSRSMAKTPTRPTTPSARPLPELLPLSAARCSTARRSFRPCCPCCRTALTRPSLGWSARLPYSAWV